ncbi:hypothetical protein ACFX11_003305 [Malus domestica]
MGASLTISRLLKAPNSLVFSTITTAAAPKNISLLTQILLLQNLLHSPHPKSPKSPPPPSNQYPPPSPSATSVPKRPSPTLTVSDPLLPRYELHDRLRGVAAV